MLQVHRLLGRPGAILTESYNICVCCQCIKLYPYFYTVFGNFMIVLCVFSVQVLFTGFAYGGLSELPESDYISCSMGSTIAGEIGMFGYKPSMLMDMLAGKRVEVSARLGPYMRTFSCDCSPTDLETALQVRVFPPEYKHLGS